MHLSALVATALLLTSPSFLVAEPWREVMRSRSGGEQGSKGLTASRARHNDCGFFSLHCSSSVALALSLSALALSLSFRLFPSLFFSLSLFLSSAVAIRVLAPSQLTSTSSSFPPQIQNENRCPGRKRLLGALLPRARVRKKKRKRKKKVFFSSGDQQTRQRGFFFSQPPLLSSLALFQNQK